MNNKNHNSQLILEKEHEKSQFNEQIETILGTKYKLKTIYEIKNKQNEEKEPFSEQLLQKLQILIDKIENFKKYNKIYIAYSGGIDSALMAKIAFDILKEKTTAITGISASIPDEEIKNAKTIAKIIGITQITIKTNELDNLQYYQNPTNRCYFCKSELYTQLHQFAQKEEQKQEQNKEKYIILDGTNADDTHDYRPGAKAGIELNIKSPLQETGLTKKEIRMIAKALEIPIWNKPATPCLSSRVAYGETITIEKLKKIELAEKKIREKGIERVRVRYENNTARIEIDKNDFIRFLENNDEITAFLKQLGFHYVALDLEGYRRGSLNLFKENKKLI